LQKAAYFDVSAFLELLRGGKDILATIETYRDFCTGATVAAQLIGGEECLLERKTLKKRRMQGLLGPVEVIPFCSEDAEKAGEVIGKLKAAGKDVGFEEAMVAAQCLRRGLTLVTNRKQFRDFKSVVGLEVQNI
jgi:predicted nucleic acid-binding protein